MCNKVILSLSSYLCFKTVPTLDLEDSRQTNLAVFFAGSLKTDQFQLRAITFTLKQEEIPCFLYIVHLIDSSCKIRHITSTVQHSIPTISFVTAHFQIAMLLLSKCKNLISANKSRAKQAAIISLFVLPREVLDSTT